jgi:hypothetical protein
LLSDPSWLEVESALKEMTQGKVSFVELAESPDESVVMTVFGDSGLYHIGILADETEQSWLLSEGRQDGQRMPIGGNLFPRDQICSDQDKVFRIVRFFFDTGKKLPEATWITDVRR